MADGFANISSTITLEKKGSAPTTITGDIYNFKESGLSRQVVYTKVISGVILDTVSDPLSITVEFDFITTDDTYTSIMNGGTNDWDYDSSDLYKLALKFNDGTDFYAILYYDAIVESLSMDMVDEVLEGHIKLTLPVKNLNGDTNYYHIVSSGDETTHDTTHGY